MKLFGLDSKYDGCDVKWITRKGVLLSNGKVVPLSEVEKNYGKG